MEEFRVEESLGFLISKTNQLMRNYFNKMIKANGLDATVEQWATLTVVYRFPGISQSDIAQRSRKDKTNVTRMLDLLEKKGYVGRQDDKHDRRMYNIHLTASGEDIVHRVFAVAEEVNRVSCESFEPEEVELLKSMLARLYHNVENAIQKTE